MNEKKLGRPSIGDKARYCVYTLKFSNKELSDLEKAILKTGDDKAKFCREAILKKIKKTLKE